MEHTGFPSDETLAAFLDGKLDSDTRRRVVEHMTTCNECYSVVAGGGREDGRVLVPRLLAAKRRRNLLRRIAIASCVAAALGMIVSLPSLDRVIHRTDPNELLVRLAEATPRYRDIETRLNRFPYRELVITRGSENPLDDPQRLRVFGIAAQIADSAQQSRTKETLHARGVAELLVGQRDAAAATLLSAVGASANRDASTAISHESDVSLLVDLSSALFSRAPNQRDHDLSLALAAAKRALDLEPASAEAAFNRALILERLELRADAITAWRRAIAIDPSSPWSIESRRHLQRLTDSSTLGQWSESSSKLELALRKSDLVTMRAIAVATSGDAIRYCEETVLPRLAIAPSNPGLAYQAQQLILVVSEATGDPFFRDVVHSIDSSRARGARNVVGALDRGLASYANGLDDIRAGRTGNARRSFALAEVQFRSAGNPLNTLASVKVASSLFGENKYEQARDKATDILAHIPTSYHSLRARIQWIIGLCDLALTQPYDALRSYSAASTEFKQLCDEQGLAIVASLMAEAYEYIGDYDSAVECRRDALRRAAAISDPLRLAGILAESARAALRNNDQAAGDVTLSRLLVLANSLNNPEVTADAQVLRVRFLKAAGANNAARLTIDQARTSLDGIRSPPVRARTAAAIALARALVTPPDEALRNLGDAVAFFHEAKNTFGVSQALIERGMLRKTHGDPAGARKDFMAALEIGRREQATFPAGALRAAMWEARQGVLEDLTEQFWVEGDYARALSCADLAHSDPAARQSTEAKRLFVESVRRSISSDDALIEYYFANGRLLAWVVTSENVAWHSIDSPVNGFALSIERLLGAMQADNSQTARHQLSHMYHVLFSPLEASVSGKKRLLIAADKDLWNVPFSALIDDRGKYLIERFEVAKTPSMALVAGSQRSRAGHQSDVAVLLVDAGVAGRPALPEAADEARAVCRSYARSSLLHGTDAEARILRGFQQASVIHVAAHARSSREAPLASGIVLADQDRTHPRILYSHDIARNRLSKAPIVVLSACSSSLSSGPHFSTSSVASAFLTAGARAVVGTLWNVNDAAVSRLTIDLHQRLCDGVSAAASLRQIQLACIASPDVRLREPRFWGVLDVTTTT